MPLVTTSPGIDLHFSDLNPAGSPAVTLLHGLGANGESWAFQVPELISHGYRILVPDLRGFGKSSYTGRSHSIWDMATDVIAMLDSVALQGSYIVGISMGGAIALQLAYDYPDRVLRLVLVNTFARLRPRTLKQFIYFASRLALLYSLGLSAQASFVTKRLFPYPGQAHLRQALMNQILQANPYGYRSTIRALARFNLMEQLKEIKCRTLVITGEKDRTVTPDIQSFLAENIPGARQVIIAGAGHGVSGEKPGDFNRELIRFLKD